MNLRAVLKLIGALLSGAVAYSLLQEVFDKRFQGGVYIPIPVTPTPASNAQAALTNPSTVTVTVPVTAQPDPSKTTVAFSVAVYQLEVGTGGSGRDLKIKKELKSNDFVNPPPTSLNITPGTPMPITFQVKSSAKVDHAAVVVMSTVQKTDGDGLYRGVGIVVIS